MRTSYFFPSTMGLEGHVLNAVELPWPWSLTKCVEERHFMTRNLGLTWDKNNLLIPFICGICHMLLITFSSEKLKYPVVQLHCFLILHLFYHAWHIRLTSCPVPLENTGHSVLGPFPATFSSNTFNLQLKLQGT